jgi:hypothetical protein
MPEHVPFVDVDEDEVEVTLCTARWCGEEATEGLESPDGEPICQGCYDREVYVCERCGEAMWADESYTVGCDTWCTRCADYHSAYCYECDERYDTDYDYDHEHDQQGLLDYNDTPLLHFRGEDPHGYYLGLELEMEDTTGHSISSAVDQVNDGALAGHFYCKSDGSLYDGMEMVSHPMSLSYWQGMESKVSNLTAALRSLGMRSWNTETAGIHVHVSAEAFGGSDKHLWLFQQMFYRNADAVSKYAGRESDQWARIRVATGDVTYYTKTRKAGGYYDLRRYMAVNLTNRNTVEIRVFRGSLNPNRVYANLELVHALVEYTRNLSFGQVKAGALNFEVFGYWLRQQDKYPHAAAHMTARGIATTRND